MEMQSVYVAFRNRGSIHVQDEVAVKGSGYPNATSVEKGGDEMSGAQTRHRSSGMYLYIVEEHCQCIEAIPVRSSGALRRENAGMSSEKRGGNFLAEYLDSG